jgi:hypothetical protein
MKCTECIDFVDNLCQKAQLGKISQVDNVSCLLRMQISLLRSIWEELTEAE